VTTAASFGVSTMSDEDVIVISDSESDTETVCDEIENYYSLGADDDGDLVDASMDIRYDLEWASGGWLDYTWNEELMELFGEFEDGNWVGEIDVLEGPDDVIENIIPRGDTSSPPSLKQLTHTALLSVADTYVFNMHEECRSECCPLKEAFPTMSKPQHWQWHYAELRAMFNGLVEDHTFPPPLATVSSLH